jgi:hypothetical protein
VIASGAGVDQGRRFIVRNGKIAENRVDLKVTFILID